MTPADPSTATGQPAKPSGDRPLRADARRNRARVLEVANEVFAKEGLSVPIDEIARRAGVGVGTVYRHFPTKEDLFEAIVVERIRRLGEDARELAATPDPGAAFFAFFDRMIVDASLNRALFDALAAGGLGKEIAAEASAVMMSGLSELLTRAQSVGAVRTDLAVADVKALMVGCLTMARHGTATPELVISVIRNGMRPVSPDRIPGA